MSANTKIEWADHTFNPWIGCTKVSPGCDNCYAKAEWDDRRHRAVWGPGNPRSRTQTWGDPEKWEKNAPHFRSCDSCGMRWHAHCAAGKERCPTCGSTAIRVARQRVFCASLADVFDNEVPPEWRHDLFNLIAATPHLDWLLLTKRPQNIVRMVQDHGCVAGNGTRYLPGNVRLGATVEDQHRANINVPALLRARELTGAAGTFLSMEPLLGRVILKRDWLDGMRKGAPYRDCFGGLHHEIDRGSCLDWVIVGGESGPGARPMHPDWARSLRDQCQAAGVSFLFKQWGEWGPDWEGAEICGNCGGTKFDLINRHGECGRCGIEDWRASDKPLDTLRRVGKKAAGRLLDGRTWDEVPV